MRTRLVWVALLALSLSSGCVRSGSTPAPPERAPQEVAHGTPAAPVPAPGAIKGPHDYKPTIHFGGPFVAEGSLFWLGWTTEDASDRKVMTRGLEGTQASIAAEPDEGFALGYPVVTGQWVIFSETPASSRQPNEWRLLARNVQTGERRLLASGDAGAMQLAFAADQGKVIWLETDWRDMQKSWSRIKVHDLGSKQAKTLVEVSFPQNIQSLDMSGSRVVYNRFDTTATGGNAGQLTYASEVHLLDLQTAADRVLANSHDAWEVKIMGDQVVWKTAADVGEYGDIVLHAISSGTSQTITTNGKSLGVFGPTIGDGFVTWSQNLGAQRRIPVYLIAEGRSIDLDQGEVFSPIARGKHLTWRWEPAPDDPRIRWWSPQG